MKIYSNRKYNKRIVPFERLKDGESLDEFFFLYLIFFFDENIWEAVFSTLAQVLFERIQKNIYFKFSNHNDERER